MRRPAAPSLFSRRHPAHVQPTVMGFWRLLLLMSHLGSQAWTFSMAAGTAQGKVMRRLLGSPVLPPQRVAILTA